MVRRRFRDRPPATTIDDNQCLAATAVTAEAARQRARRDRIETRSRSALERDRRAELLLTDALNALAQRDASVAHWEAHAGGALAAAVGLGLSATTCAARSGLGVVEVRRLVRLARETTALG